MNEWNSWGPNHFPLFRAISAFFIHLNFSVCVFFSNQEGLFCFVCLIYVANIIWQEARIVLLPR